MNLSIKSKRILVIGDVMLDTYYIGDVTRISPEAPVPVFKKKDERSVLGGAGNVAANLVAAKQEVYILSTIGQDETGERLRNKFDEIGINTDYLMSCKKDTTSKIRFIAGNNQQVLRLDIEQTTQLSTDECKMIISKICDDNIAQFDLILISDYLKGLLTKDFSKEIITLANQHKIKVIIDVKDPDIDKYKGAFLIKPNLKELQDLVGIKIKTKEEIIECSKLLRNKCECEYVLTTCGDAGMVLVGKNKEYTVRSVGHEVFDVTGAGDTVIAYIAVCLANDMDIQEAVDISNIAAGIQVSKLGTSQVYLREIKNHLNRSRIAYKDKILHSTDAEIIKKLHRDQKIVFTNGCFDILHIGHIRYLQDASRLGDVLIIGLNSDASVRRLKGNDRPINSQEERAEMLCSLGCVDYVIVFGEDTPIEVIKLIQPDVIVKGGDYNRDEVIGREYVESKGGELVLLPFVKGKSTTNIIKKIQNRSRGT